MTLAGTADEEADFVSAVLLAAFGRPGAPAFRCRLHVRWRDGSVSRHEVDAAGRVHLVMAVPIAAFLCVIPAGTA